MYRALRRVGSVWFVQMTLSPYETVVASSMSSTAITWPWSRHAGPAESRVGIRGRSRSTWAMTSRPSACKVVTRIAGESGPCSAWLSRSTATMNASAVSSATTRISVGPATRSIPTSPYSWRFASAT